MIIGHESDTNLLNNDMKKLKTTESETVMIKLTISYKLPSAAAFILKRMGSLAQNFIHDTILSDLKRFEKYLFSFSSTLKSLIVRSDM